MCLNNVEEATDPADPTYQKLMQTDPESAKASDTRCSWRACPKGRGGVGHISACRSSRRDMR